MHVYRSTNSKLIYIFPLQKSNIYLVYICCNFFHRCLIVQVGNLNLDTNLENISFYAMLITCKCTPLGKKLDYNTNNDPPYLAITLKFEPTSPWGGRKGVNHKENFISSVLMWFAFALFI